MFVSPLTTPASSLESQCRRLYRQALLVPILWDLNADSTSFSVLKIYSYFCAFISCCLSDVWVLGDWGQKCR